MWECRYSGGMLKRDDLAMSRRWVGAVAVWALMAGVALGQTVPPVCSVAGAKRPAVGAGDASGASDAGGD